jgi:glycosyltransferase involved in cell wall biosynthesis
VTASDRKRVLVVGSGWRFTSGISYYTCRLANALSGHHDVGAILMRQLLPTRLYPGRDRVGQPLNDLRYDDRVEVFDGIDWWGLPSLARAVRFLRRFRPDVLVLQWWTGAVLHSYLILCAAARIARVPVVIEFHEVQDTGEARLRWAARYVRACIKPLLGAASGIVVHSRFDQEQIQRVYGVSPVPQVVARHGPYDHHQAPRRAAASEERNILFFGTIRPYKGLEDLIEAFGRLPEEWRLTVVGETWEGWTRPAESIACSPARERITFVNRYVTDAEVNEFFAGADLVVLPYRRSSASGPLHIAMSRGLPVVVTAVGGLVEAAGGYSGVRFVPVGDPVALAEGMLGAVGLMGRRHVDPCSWEQTVLAYDELFVQVGLYSPVVPSQVAVDEGGKLSDPTVSLGPTQPGGGGSWGAG